MLAYIKGKIIKKAEKALIIENQNLGYLIFTPMSILTNSHISTEIELWLYHHIKEDASTLYGFNNQEQLELFSKFLSISGIGPKVALAILSQHSCGIIRKAILNDDITTFKAVSGIGKKTAMRIIIELKNKLPKDIFDNQDVANDVLDALKNLGYNHNQIQSLLENLPKDITSPEEQIKWALKNIHK